MRLPGRLLVLALPVFALFPVLALFHLATGCIVGPSGTFCSLDIGPVNAPDVPNIGPIETCTPQYPSCTPPNSGSPGYQCCQQTTLADGTTELQCMPNDAAAYQTAAVDAGSE